MTVCASALDASFELLGFEHRAADLVIFAVGWSLGWLLLWRPRHLETGHLEAGHHAIDAVRAAARAPVAVIIPARNEAHALPHLLRPLVAQRREGDRIIVVDDHSDDGTGRVAAAFDVEVMVPPELPDGWLGKPHACWTAAHTADEDVLVFLDADVRPGPTLLDDLEHRVTADPDTLVSMQPWHRMHTVAEQPSILCNITALMACGAFTALGPRTASTVAFGPVIAVSNEAYRRSGGHGDPRVRTMHTEDIGLAQAVGRSDLFIGSPNATTFRMYPGGLGELVRGWTRSLATGARYTRWWLALATAAWVCSVAGGWIALPIVYPLSALQIWVLGRRSGTIDPAAALLYPLLVVVFVVIFVRSAFAIVFRREVTWKGRGVEARAG